MNQKSPDTADNHLAWLAVKIEEKLGWGNVSDWTERNFQALGDLLEKETGERMSITTLKRAMGRISRKSLPHPRTLDGLAQFMGFEDWTQYSFAAQQEANLKSENTEPPADKEDTSPPNNQTAIVQNTDDSEADDETLTKEDVSSFFQSKWLLATLIAIVVIAVAYIFSLRQTLKDLQKLTVATEIQTDSSLIPASQIPDEQRGEIKVSYNDYDYDKNNFVVSVSYYIPDINLTNINLIKFEGEMNYLNINEESKQGVATHTYTKPGIYHIKVFSNKRTMAQKTIVIPTRDWTGYIYFDKKESENYELFDTRKNSQFKLKERLDDKHIRFWTSYQNFKDFPTATDRFIIKTRFRNTALNNETRDGNSYLEILGDENIIRVQMANTNSNGGFYQVFSEQKYKVKSGSPLAFKADLSEWQELVIENNDKHLTVRLGDKTLHQTTYTESIGGIRGFEFTFAGLGEVDYLKIYSLENKLLYSEEFAGRRTQSAF